jgi:heptosyltransferase I
MKILIVKTSALGDIIHAFPVVDYLKCKFPSATIDWVVESPCSSLVETHPQIRRAIPINTKRWRKGIWTSDIRKEIRSAFQQLRQEKYDIIFDLQGNIKSGLITACAKGTVKAGFSWDSVAEWPNALCTNRRISVSKEQAVRDAYLQLVQTYFQDYSPHTTSSVTLLLSPEEQLQLSTIKASLEASNDQKKPFIMVCHGSNWKNKQLTLEALTEFLQLLQDHLNCFFVFGWGTPPEREEAAKLQNSFNHSVLLEKVSLPLLQHVMSDMDWIIAMDSLPLHLAATTGVQTFSVFGPSLAARYSPQGPRHHSVQGSCPYGRTFKTRCPILRSCPTGACIRSLSGQTIFDAFINKLEPSK